MATWCPDLTGDLAANLVADAHGTFMERSRQTYNTAISSLNAMGNIELAPYDFSVSFDFDGQLAPFRRPTRPTIDDSAFELRTPDVPGPAPGFTPHQLSFTTAPELGVEPPVLTFGPRPVTPNIPIPVAPPPPDDIEIPVAPGYVLPEVPTFEQLNLPSVPSITLPEFEGERPVWIDPPFNETWSFEAEPYEVALKDRLIAAIDPMLQASTALPDHIESAIFQRARSRIEAETGREVDQAYAEFANRGFAEPTGQLAGRISQIRQAGQNAVAEAARDAAIKQFEETLQNLRFAIVQGAALEGVYAQLHIEDQRIALQAATFQRESAIAVLNAKIGIFNARQQAYATDAQVLEARIRATLAVIELYRAQIEGEMAKGQINEQRVRLYEGLLRGINVMSDFYRNQVEAVKVRSDIDRNIVERFRAEVSAYDTRWRAFASEWQGWTASAEGEGKRADVYRTMVDAGMKRIDAWAMGNRMNIDGERLRMDQHGQQLQAWEGDIRRFVAILDGERARLAAVASQVEAQAGMYTADAQVEAAASAATDRSFELGLAAANARVSTQLKEAEMHIEQLRKMVDQAIAIADAKMRVAAQLAASTMSAVGYNAGVNSSKSRSSSCSSNFNFQGEIMDAGL